MAEDPEDAVEDAQPAPLALLGGDPALQLPVDGGGPHQAPIRRRPVGGIDEARLGLPPAHPTVTADELLERGHLVGAGVDPADEDQVADVIDAVEVAKLADASGP